MSKYEDAVTEVRSVLAEWDPRPLDDVIATKVVERLIAKGLIQSTDQDELVAPQYRTGPLKPGRTVVGGPKAEEHFPGSTFRDLRDGGHSSEQFTG